MHAVSITRKAILAVKKQVGTTSTTLVALNVSSTTSLCRTETLDVP